MPEEVSLNLIELAVEFFDLQNEQVPKQVVQSSLEFASVAVHKYKELEAQVIAKMMVQADGEVEDVEEEKGPSVLTARELCQVVELSRSLRRGSSPAGDLYHAINYMLAREGQDPDWELVLQELSELIPEEEEQGPK